MLDWFLPTTKVSGIHSLLLAQVTVIGSYTEDINSLKLFQFYLLVNDVGISCCISPVSITQLKSWTHD